MEMLNMLLAIDPDHILRGLVIVFFMMEIFFRRLASVGNKLNHLLHNFLFQLLAISIGSILGFMIVTTYDWISSNEFGLFYLISMFFFFLRHANLLYPSLTDKVFGWLFVTPNYHKIYHDQDQFYTDSNYGTLFIIWDKIFGTFKTKPVEEIIYGLKQFEGAKKILFLSGEKSFYEYKT